MREITIEGRRTVLCLVLLTLWYLAATLLHLADFPRLDWAQMGIVAPAHKLASEGVYGNDLFAGFHRSELRNYEYMPAYPLLVALSFKMLGVGVFEARLVSILCGWLAVLLTFQVGRQLYGSAVGLVAAALLCLLRLGLLPATTGIPLLDFARLIRYDILVPLAVLAAASCFLGASSPSDAKRPARSGPLARGAAYLEAGMFAGLATLAHVYGGFILVVFVAALLWHRGWRTVRSGPLFLLVGGWVLAMLPWLLYVLQDLQAYSGQMSRHQARFDLLDPGFYWHNLQREIWRYAPWLKGGFPETFLQARIGIWLVLAGLPAGMHFLWQRIRHAGRLADRFLFLSLPLLGLCLALLMFMKRYVYTLLILPFMALLLAYALVELWQRWAERKILRAALVALGVLIVGEGAVGVSRSLAAARGSSPYMELCRAIGEPIPSGSRLLISQPYWLGLAQQDDFELRSVQLVFLRAPSMTVPEAMAQLAPDYVVIESYFLEPGVEHPRGPPPGSEEKRRFLELGAYLDRWCSNEIARYPDPDYGTIEVYHCTTDIGGSIEPAGPRHTGRPVVSAD